jgi:hypothetical protein
VTFDYITLPYQVYYRDNRFLLSPSHLSRLDERVPHCNTAYPKAPVNSFIKILDLKLRVNTVDWLCLRRISDMQYGFENINNINITLVWRTCDWHVRGISTWFEHGWMNNFLVDHVFPGVWFKADGQLTFLYDNEGPWHYFENFDVGDRDKIEKVIKDSVQFNKGKRPALVADAIAGRSD